MKKHPAAFIGLLRGVNVGGNNALPMPELCSLCTELGCADVRSWKSWSQRLASNCLMRTEACLAAERKKLEETRQRGQAISHPRQAISLRYSPTPSSPS